MGGQAYSTSQQSQYQEALNDRVSVPSRPHIKVILAVSSSVCCAASRGEAAKPPVAKQSAVSRADFLTSDRHAMPLTCE